VSGQSSLIQSLNRSELCSRGFKHLLQGTVVVNLRCGEVNSVAVRVALSDFLCDLVASVLDGLGGEQQPW